jgi:methylglutaconyl-CoA hydratase
MALVGSRTARGVATVTLDSPHNRNALSKQLITELLEALDAARADDAVRVIVLDHTGPVFCSGADLKETAAAGAAIPADRSGAASGGATDRGAMPISQVGDVLERLWNSPKPVVAKVGGPARAGGLGLIAAADLAVCTTDATFAFTEVRLGVIPAVISGPVLRRLSPRAAAELYLTGSIFDGTRAAAVGLVTAAVEADRLDETVDGFVAALVRGAPGALAATKQLLQRRPADTFGEDMARLTALSLDHFGSAEGMEGVLAFREKRDPHWVPSP